MTWSKLTESEKIAVAHLGKVALDKSMTSTVVPASHFAQDDGRIELLAPIAKVQKILSRALKPGRKLVDVVMFEEGKMVETTTTNVAEVEKKTGKKTMAGATVSKPDQGCPMPVLTKADVRATEVLFAFLNENQQEDFRNHNSFVSQGIVTGHRYMVTSRHATDRLAQYRRQLFDLDENRPYCVHDYTVPAAEEMLALHLLLQLPGHEDYLRHLE